MTVYDKADWHLEGDFPSDLDSYQAFVLTGFFVGWLLERNFCEPWVAEDSADAAALFHARQITAPRLFEAMDGVLSSDMVLPAIRQFVRGYFDLQTGAYMKDYEHTFCQFLPTLYHVSDSWDNYTKICKVIDAAYDNWQSRRADA